VTAKLVAWLIALAVQFVVLYLVRRGPLRKLKAAERDFANLSEWTACVMAEADERREIAKRCVACRQRHVVPAHERVQPADRGADE